MTEGGFQKTGWHWTRKGWKRTPKHAQAVKKAAPPPKRRPRKKARAKDAAPEAPKLTAGKAGAVSAPTLAPKPETPTTPDYSELDAVTKRLSRPPSRRRSVHPPWIKAKPQPTTAPAGRVWSGKYADLSKPSGETPDP